MRAQFIMIRKIASEARYVALLVLIAGVVFAAVGRQYRVSAALLVIVVLLLSPGWIQAYFWSEMRAGLDQLNRCNYAQSKAHSARFLAQLQARPWLKKLTWLKAGEYSRDPEVLARGNLGAALWKLGEVEAAQEQFLLAIRLDPQCPLAPLYMGRLLLGTTTTTVAMPWLDKAEALGFMGARSIMLESENQPMPPAEGAFVLELINDDVTKMEFVIAALERLFGLTGAEAIKIMLTVHRNGSAVCAGFDNGAAAQAKADELTALARASDFPLSCRVVAR
jgi:ATP-dependent Clp protease adaptor protein ClpS